MVLFFFFSPAYLALSKPQASQHTELLEFYLSKRVLIPRELRGVPDAAEKSVATPYLKLVGGRGERNSRVLKRSRDMKENNCYVRDKNLA